MRIRFEAWALAFALVAPAAAQAPAAGATQLLAEVDSVGFNTRARMGVGGVVALDVYPVLLFKSGDALTHVKRLAEGGSLAALQLQHAADFTRWRRSGGELQLQDKQGEWKKLPLQTTYARLPDGLRLSGLYRPSSGTGNVAFGGKQTVAAVNDYRFTADGKVTRGGGAGARSGSYRIEGLTLHISYAGGSSERRILITDPKDSRGAVWIDGQGYVRKDR